MKKISGLIYDRLYLPIFPQLDEVYEELRRAFSHFNPEYAKRRALGFWVGGTPRDIKSWRNEVLAPFDRVPFSGMVCLSLPRGGQGKVEQTLRQYRLEVDWIDRRIGLPPVKNWRNSVVLRPDQERLVRRILEAESCLIRSPTGSGKCLGATTKVLYAHGAIVEAQNVQVGDLLLAQDSVPRRVLSTTKGNGHLYLIAPHQGKPWVANRDHILVLRDIIDDRDLELSVGKYLALPDEQRDRLRAFFPEYPIEYSVSFSVPPPLPPYFVGVWFMSHAGSSVAGMWLKSREMVSTVRRTLEEDIDWTETQAKTGDIYLELNRRHPYVDLLQDFSLLDGIPVSYLLGTVGERLEFLAGAVDASANVVDGNFVIRRGKAVKKIEELQRLARSLGIATQVRYVHGAHELTLRGYIDRIPCRRKEHQLERKPNAAYHYLSRLRVEPVGRGNYYGWTLSGDGRFLLEDYQVTHNTEVALKVAESFLIETGPVIVVVWETGLARQWIDRVCKRFGVEEREVGFIGGGVHRIRPITIAMQQSLWKKGRQIAPHFGAIIADEVQRFAAKTYQLAMDVFPGRYRVGFSADETRKDGLEFLIYETFGEIAGEVKKDRLIVEGKIHDVIQRVVPTDFAYEVEWNGERYGWRDLPAEMKNYQLLLDRLCTDEARNDLIWRFMAPAIRAGKTLMVVTSRVAHAHYWADRIASTGVKVGLMLGGAQNASEFKRTRDGLLKGTIQVSVGTNQKSGVGHDIPRWDRGFIVTPHAGNVQQYEQINGRLRRPCDGKTDAVTYYFWDPSIYPRHLDIISKRYPHTFVWKNKEFLRV